MTKDAILDLYDAAYARSYDAKFLHADIAKADTAHEVSMLQSLLRTKHTWLDVACGTGYFLSCFPQVARAGLDLSPAMLALARAANPNVPCYEASYLETRPLWNNQWDLVTCMWYAYGLVRTMDDLAQLVANLASWTSPQGTCFLPLADPQLIAGVSLPTPKTGSWPGQICVTGITWTYLEDDGKKVHSHQFAPHVDFMRELFAQWFESVELHTYPPHPQDGSFRRALVASRKRLLPGPSAP